MSFSEKLIVATYNMFNHALGMADFIKNEVEENVNEIYNKSVIYVMDEEGNHAQQVALEEITLEDGSKVYNLRLKFDR